MVFRAIKTKHTHSSVFYNCLYKLLLPYNTLHIEDQSVNPWLKAFCSQGSNCVKRAGSIRHCLLGALSKVHGGRTKCTPLANGLNGRAKSTSNYRRLQRFFKGIEFDQTLVARFVLSFLPADERLLVSMDRTNWQLGKTEINLLFIGVVYKGIVLPLFWTALSKAGNSD